MSEENAGNGLFELTPFEAGLGGFALGLAGGYLLVALQVLFR
jgi:hypothetical protein